MDELLIPMVVKAGGGLSMATGAFTVGLAIQTALVFRMSGRIPAIVFAMVLIGMTAFVFGWKTLQGSGRAAMAAAVASGLVATLGTAWAITGLRSGLLSPLSFGVVALATGAAILTIVAIGPARRVSAAREKLRAEGYDFGL